MSRPIIAIDIDDVLANSTDALRREVNKRLGANLQAAHYSVPGDYWSYYERVWEDNGLAGRITMDELDPQMKADQSHIEPHDGSLRVLRELAERFNLVVVTSRGEHWQKATQTWLAQRFPGVFSDVVFAGNLASQTPITKGEMCKQLGAQWLIDDNVGHCETALVAGVMPVLFGEYGWHHAAPADMVRCKDWQAVLEYFDGRDS